MNDLINDLYQEIILDHGREPRNFGECDPHNKSADGHNPLCGDNLKLTFLLNDQNIIEDIKFTNLAIFPNRRQNKAHNRKKNKHWQPNT